MMQKDALAKYLLSTSKIVDEVSFGASAQVGGFEIAARRGSKWVVRQIPTKELEIGINPAGIVLAEFADMERSLFTREEMFAIAIGRAVWNAANMKGAR